MYCLQCRTAIHHDDNCMSGGHKYVSDEAGQLIETDLHFAGAAFVAELPKLSKELVCLFCTKSQPFARPWIGQFDGDLQGTAVCLNCHEYRRHALLEVVSGAIEIVVLDPAVTKCIYSTDSGHMWIEMLLTPGLRQRVQVGERAVLSKLPLCVLRMAIQPEKPGAALTWNVTHDADVWMVHPREGEAGAMVTKVGRHVPPLAATPKQARQKAVEIAASKRTLSQDFGEQFYSLRLLWNRLTAEERATWFQIALANPYAQELFQQSVSVEVDKKAAQDAEYKKVRDATYWHRFLPDAAANALTTAPVESAVQTGQSKRWDQVMKKIQVAEDAKLLVAINPSPAPQGSTTADTSVVDLYLEKAKKLSGP